MNDQLTTDEARDTRQPESEGRVVLQRLVRRRLMKLTPNDVITVESEDGILHEMVVKSQDLAAKTITGEVANWTGGKERGKVVETITVPDHCISWVGHRKLQ